MAAASPRVAPGKRVALVGAPGAGKTTLMRMIWGNYLAGGVIRVCGLDVARAAPAAPRQIIAQPRATQGRVSQFPRAARDWKVDLTAFLPGLAA